MSKNDSPTKQRRKAVYDKAEKICYKLKGAEYRDNLNPYPLYSFDFERFKKFYIKLKNSYDRMESICDDMAEVYGEFRPDKLGNSENSVDNRRQIHRVMRSTF